MKVTIPFQEDFRDAMLGGAKCVTTRTKKYGKVGDTFDAFEAMFKILAVNRVELQHVASHIYKGEGFDTPDAFKDYWRRLHPRKGFVPYQKVYAHLFRKEGP